MTKLIFSIFIDTNTNKGKHIETFSKLKEHYNRLVDVKKQYAKSIGAEYKVFTNDEMWSSFKNRVKDYEFDVLNLYKIYLLEELSKQYDNVLYMDMDIVPNTNVSIFETFDMNKICVRSINATIDVLPEKMSKHIKSEKKSYYEIMSQLDRYNEHIKALQKRAMLINQNIVCNDYEIANTGIVAGNKSAIGKLKFAERLDEMLKVLNDTKEECFYGEKITDYFFANNEIFFHYLLDKYKVEWFNLPESWHKIHYTREANFTPDFKESHMIHMISKKFDELWKLLDNVDSK